MLLKFFLVIMIAMNLLIFRITKFRTINLLTELLLLSDIKYIISVHILIQRSISESSFNFYLTISLDSICANYKYLIFFQERQFFINNLSLFY